MTSLTKRKKEILDLAAQGMGDKQIARTLGVGVATVQTHWKQIREQLGAATRGEAIAKLLLSDLVDAKQQLETLRTTVANDLPSNSPDPDVATLKKALEEQATFITKTIAATDKKIARLAAALAQLERLDQSSSDQGVVLHEGEYGASWRKYFMSPSARAFGYDPEAWVRGEVNFFDYIAEPYVVRNIPLFKPFERGVHRLPLTYAIQTKLGVRFFLDLLTCEFLDDSGVGTYRGISIDITEWHSHLKEMADAGMLQPIAGTLEPPSIEG